VFVVLRVDELGDAPIPDRPDVVATKAFWSQEEADAEAQRLNLINAGKGSEYVVRVARIESA
jgi:hypothetical protein